jgi:hypothetical protein
MAGEASEGIIVLHTDGKAPTELARTVLDAVGWSTATAT